MSGQVLVVRNADPQDFADAVEWHFLRAWEVFTPPVYAAEEWVCLLRRDDACSLVEATLLRQGKGWAWRKEEGGKVFYAFTRDGEMVEMEAEAFILFAVQEGWLR